MVVGETVLWPFQNRGSSYLSSLETQDITGFPCGKASFSTLLIMSEHVQLPAYKQNLQKAS